MFVVYALLPLCWWFVAVSGVRTYLRTKATAPLLVGAGATLLAIGATLSAYLALRSVFGALPEDLLDSRALVSPTGQSFLAGLGIVLLVSGVLLLLGNQGKG
jgi:hypothetical protein